MRKLTFVAAILACLVTPVAAQTAKQVLTIDVPNDAATLDPHLQWDTDSYGVYRNILDNLLTRDAAGKIVPQIATAWRFVDDTHVEFDIRADIKFQDGTPLSAEDVVFSVKRITNPAFKSPQLSQFDQVADALDVGFRHNRQLDELGEQHRIRFLHREADFGRPQRLRVGNLIKL